MAIYKEIVTKAVIGKGKKKLINSYFLLPESTPSTVLGCWIINHKFKGYEKAGKIMIDGSLDVNIWYSHDSDTKTAVATKTFTYNESVSIKINDEIDVANSDIIIRSLNGPTCNNVKIVDNKINFEVEKELGIEVVGDAKVKIAVEQEEEPWDLIRDEELDEKDLTEIDEKVTETLK